MNRLFLLFSHVITKEQIKEAKERFEIDEFVKLPDNLQESWSNVPHEGDLANSYLDDIKKFLSLNKVEKNYILIQGESGVTYTMVNWAFDNGFIPIYSTTKRIYNCTFNSNGSVTNQHIFKHVTFRRYKE